MDDTSFYDRRGAVLGERLQLYDEVAVTLAEEHKKT
jgi:hypothetical protein